MMKPRISLFAEQEREGRREKLGNPAVMGARLRIHLWLVKNWKFGGCELFRLRITMGRATNPLHLHLQDVLTPGNALRREETACFGNVLASA